MSDQGADGFARIPLLCRDSTPIGRVAVVPPFLTPPAVLRWGDRTFLRDEHGRYRECFALDVVATEDAGPAHDVRPSPPDGRPAPRPSTAPAAAPLDAAAGAPFSED